MLVFIIATENTESTEIEFIVISFWLIVNQDYTKHKKCESFSSLHLCVLCGK